ncbi:MAG TPA: lysylphosphatidylglycerol synthase transmembrane domain-containing protein [Kineosporiaceae bacterium]|nr:lysylphosphatidylglycerol synthase transmembrane domain-containing protein [Kineosporiaceae bacterium]
MIRRVWRWSRLIGGAGILALLGWRLGSEPFLNGLRVVDSTTLTAALLLGGVTTVLSAWRWSLVARGLGMRVPLRDAVSDYYRSLFINAVLPGGVLGDVHRAVRHGRGVGDVSRAVKAVVLERTAGQIVLVAAVVTVLLVDPAPMLPQMLARSATMLALILLVATVAGGTAVLLRRGWSGSVAAVRTWSSDVRRGLLSRGNRLGILATSTGVLAGHVATFVIAARAAGATASLGRLLPLLLLALLAMTLPLNVGGWGPREGATAWAFSAAGLGAAQGLTVAVVYGMFALVASLPGAAVMATDWIARARADRQPQPVTVTRAALIAVS